MLSHFLILYAIYLISKVITVQNYFWGFGSYFYEAIDMTYDTIETLPRTLMHYFLSKVEYFYYGCLMALADAMM